MRALIVSDLHGNMEALGALPQDYDEMWVLGDLVNYGPNPAEAVEFVRAHAAVVVRGNHDQAIGCGDNPQCSARFRLMAEEMGRYTARALSEEQRAFLRDLPLAAIKEADGRRAFLCHATPADPLYRYRPAVSPAWIADLERIGADVLLTGHTHLPFLRHFAGKTVANPGSVGQPKAGSPRASFAVWQEGVITLHSVPYDWQRTVSKLQELPLSPAVLEDLTTVLRNGGI